ETPPEVAPERCAAFRTAGHASTDDRTAARSRPLVDNHFHHVTSSSDNPLPARVPCPGGDEDGGGMRASTGLVFSGLFARAVFIESTPRPGVWCSSRPGPRGRPTSTLHSVPAGFSPPAWCSLQLRSEPRVGACRSALDPPPDHQAA